MLMLVLASCLGFSPRTLQTTISELTVGLVFGAAYAIAVATFRWWNSQGRIQPLIGLLVIGMATLGSAFAGFVVLDWLFPNGGIVLIARRVLAVELAAGLVLLVAVLLLPGVKRITAAVLIAAIVAAFPLRSLLTEGQIADAAHPLREVKHVDSSLYGLKVTDYSRWIPRSIAHGGSLALLDDKLLVANADGGLYLVAETQDSSSLDVNKLPFAIPINSEVFVSESKKIFSQSASDAVEIQDFRVAALAARKIGETFRILASHHYWIANRQCYVLRVSMLQGSLTELTSSSSNIGWKTVFDTQPCLPFDTEGTRGPRFEGYENGGRIVFMSDDIILLSVGDQGSDGVNRSAMLAQDNKSSYGKTLLIDLTTGKEEIFTTGHRNPQGLYANADGTILLTEHGPRGGDELNQLVKGRNYGWPMVTYGTDYSKHSWPFNAVQGRHEGYERPVYSFVPSVGVTSIIQSHGAEFPLWEGDYLVSSLKARTVYRLRARDQRIVFAEPIELGQKIRDLTVLPNGRIVALTPSQDLLFIEADNTVSGESLVAACTACHGINESDRSGLGPNLWQVVGRPIASDKNFSYSKALKQLDDRWTPQRLDAFLASPSKFAPGTSMLFPGMESEAERKMLIDYLKTLKRTW